MFSSLHLIRICLQHPGFCITSSNVNTSAPARQSSFKSPITLTKVDYSSLMVASLSPGPGGEILHPSCKLVVHVHVCHPKFVSNHVLLRNLTILM